MIKILSLLNGCKTYFGFIGLGLTGILWKAGVIDQVTAEYAGMLFASLAGLGVSHKIAKLQPK